MHFIKAGKVTQLNQRRRHSEYCRTDACFNKLFWLCLKEKLYFNHSTLIQRLPAIKILVRDAASFTIAIFSTHVIVNADQSLYLALTVFRSMHIFKTKSSLMLLFQNRFICFKVSQFVQEKQSRHTVIEVGERSLPSSDFCRYRTTSRNSSLPKIRPSSVHI